MLWHRILAGDVLWTNSPGTEARVKRWLEGLGQKLAPSPFAATILISGRSSNSCLEFNWLKRWRSADDESRWSEFETRWVSFLPLGGRNRYHGSNWLSCRKPIKVIGWGCLKLSLDGGNSHGMSFLFICRWSCFELRNQLLSEPGLKPVTTMLDFVAPYQFCLWAGVDIF